MTVADRFPTIPKNSKVALSLSGGLDSTTLLHYLVSVVGPENVYAISFDYNQRHDIELACAEMQVDAAGLPPENYQVVDVSFMAEMANNTSSMVKGDVPTPTVQEALGDPQPTTYMPMRNLIFSSLVAAFAESNGCNYVALGIQRVDQFGYWDTTLDFVDRLQAVFDLNRKNPIKLFTPFVEATKKDEIELGIELGIDYGLTWTSYSGPKNKDGSPWGTPGEEDGFVQDKREFMRILLEKNFIPYAEIDNTASADRYNAFKKLGLEDPIPYIDESASPS